MQTNRELITALADQSETTRMLLDQLFKLLGDKAEMVFNNQEVESLTIKLDHSTKWVAEWANELEERSKELDHLQVIEIRETTTISR